MCGYEFGGKKVILARNYIEEYRHSPSKKRLLVLAPYMNNKILHRGILSLVYKSTYDGWLVAVERPRLTTPALSESKLDQLQEMTIRLLNNMTGLIHRQRVIEIIFKKFDFLPNSSHINTALKKDIPRLSKLQFLSFRELGLSDAKRRSSRERV